MLDWEGLFKRYVWDNRTTPYFISVAKLNRRQADYEILAYTLFIGVLFSIVAIAALSPRGALGGSPLVALYAFSVVCAAVLLQFTKLLPAGIYLAATPLAGLFYIFVFGLSSKREMVDTAIIAGLLMLFLWYSIRLINLVRMYPDLPETDEKPPTRRLFK